MPNTPLSGATLAADHVRRAIENLELPHANSVATDRVTLSIGGVAAFAADACPERLIAAADAGLYRAKREGRNRIVVAKFE